MADAVKSPTKKVAAAAAKPKKVSTHPKYSEMVRAAVEALKERGGSSRQAILRYMVLNYKVGSDEKVVNQHLKVALRAGVKSEMLKQSKGSGASGSFKLGDAAKKKPDKPKVKKPAAAKPKKTPTKAKKTEDKKKATPKKKKAVTAAKAVVEKIKKPKADKPKKAEKPKKAAKTDKAKPKAAKTTKVAKPKEPKTKAPKAKKVLKTPKKSASKK